MSRSMMLPVVTWMWNMACHFRVRSYYDAKTDTHKYIGQCLLCDVQPGSLYL